MADSLDLFTGVLLTAIGLVLIYGSIIYRLIDLILIIGVLITIFGLYKLLPAFLLRLMDSRSVRSRSKGPKLSGSKNSSNGSILKAGVEELSNFLDGDDKGNGKSRKFLEGREKTSSLDSPNQMTFDEYMNKSKTDFDTDYSPKEVKPIFRDDTIDESKQVLRTKPVEEEKPKFKLPSIKRNSKKKPKSRSYAFLRDDNSEQSPDKVYFTPNYEKPMKVSRKPKRKSENKIDLSASPKRSKEISQALASVGKTETIYDSNVSDESFSLMPKEIDEELIMPINEIDLDAPSEEQAIYTLSQSENTVYNNVIYDDGGDDFYITPIHADSNEERLPSDEVEVYFDDEPQMGEENIYSEEINILELDDGYITVEASGDDFTITPEPLPRPTSIASTNPISKKESVTNLSRPHRKSVSLPRPTAVSGLARPHKKNVIPRPAESKEDNISSAVSGIEELGEIPKNDLVKELPKEDSPSILPIDESIAELPEEESISKEGLDNIIPDSSDNTIQIDPNNPESLPIPKLLNSYVICEKGILTSQEAFEEVASHSKEEILLEAPTIKDMGERFLSSIAEIKTRVIIQEFDLEDISYVLLLSSLIKKGVEIKTLPIVNSFNLIGDTSHALLISNSVDEEDFEYGAVYTDEPSIENIKELFESSWKIANDLDISGLNESEE